MYIMAKYRLLVDSDIYSFEKTMVWIMAENTFQLINVFDFIEKYPLDST